MLNNILETASLNWEKIKKQDQGQTNVVRVFNGTVNGISGLVLERYGCVGVIIAYENNCSMSIESLRTLAKSWYEKELLDCVVLKFFKVDRSSGGHEASEVVAGNISHDRIFVKENGVEFLVEPLSSLSTGVFMDQRTMRKWVLENGSGKKVFNGFSYTCLFSLFALKGGAREVWSVDISKKYLAWGNENINLGSIDGKLHKSFCRDVESALLSAKKKNESFDLIVLDPPSFSRVDGTVFRVEDRVSPLTQLAFELLSPGGALYFSNNYQKWSSHDFVTEVKNALASTTKWQIAKLPVLGFDVEKSEQELHRVLIVKTI